MIVSSTRPWRRRLVGFFGMAPFPIFGYAFPWAVCIAVPVLFLRRAQQWPTLTRALLGVSIAGGMALVLSAALQNTAIPSLLVHYLSFALFVTCAVKITYSVESACQLAVYAAIGTVLFYLVIGTNHTSNSFEHLWKYGVAAPVSVIVIALLTKHASKRIIYIVCLAALGGLSMSLGFRSHGLVCAVALIAVIVKGSAAQHWVLKSAFACVGIYVAGIVLPNAISAGVFGDSVQRRTIEQTAQGASPLLAGRVEPPLSMAMILERPLLGWGNVDNLDRETLSSGLSIAQRYGLSWDTVDQVWLRDDGRVSLHSIFFEGWATGGFFAVLLPLAIVVLFVYALIRSTGRYSPFVDLIAIQGIWDVLFSTWGYNQAYTLAFSVVVAAWSLTKQRNAGESVLISTVAGLSRTTYFNRSN